MYILHPHVYDHPLYKFIQLCIAPLPGCTPFHAYRNIRVLYPKLKLRLHTPRIRVDNMGNVYLLQDV